MNDELIDLTHDSKPYRTALWPVIPMLLIGALYAVWLWMPYYEWATMSEPIPKPPTIVQTMWYEVGPDEWQERGTISAVHSEGVDFTTTITDGSGIRMDWGDGR